MLISSIYTKVHNYSQAIMFYKKALGIYSKIGNWKMEATLLMNMSDVYREAGDEAKALVYGEDALRVYAELDDEKELSKAMTKLGVLCGLIGDFEKALDFFQQAFKIDIEINDTKKQSEDLLNIVRTISFSGDHLQALDYCQQSLVKSKEVEYNKGAGDVFSAMAGIYELEGDYSKALAYLNKAIEAYESCRETVRRGQALSVMANMNMEIGDHDKAIDFLQKALDIQKRNRDTLGEGFTQEKMGRFYYEQGDYTKAFQYFQESLKIGMKENVDLLISYSLAGIGDVYTSLNKNQAALLTYEEIEDSVRLGQIYNKMGNYEKAVELFNNSIANLTQNEVLYSSRLIDNYLGLGESFSHLKRFRDAADNYLEAINIIERVRGKLKASETMTVYLSKQFQPYEDIVGVLFQLLNLSKIPDDTWKTFGENYAEIAFHFVEKGKARVLVEMLAVRRQGDISELVPNLLSEKEARLTNYLSILQSKVDEAFEKGKKPYEMINKEIRKTEAELETFVAQIKREYPDYAALRYPEAMTVVKLPLLENEHLIEYQVTEDATCLFVVQKGKVDKFLKISIIRKELENKIRHFRAAFEDVDKLDQFNPQKAHELYTLLVAPGLEGFDQTTHLVIVPDGPLHLLPFETLVVDAENATKTIDPETRIPSYHSVTYLADQWEVSYYQSATVLTINRTTTEKKLIWEKPLFAVADPVFNADDPRLPESFESETPLLASTELETESVIFPIRSAAEENGYAFHRLKETRDEVLTIGKLYGATEGIPEIKLGLDANERDIKQMDLIPYQNIIFATHGILENEVPYLQQPALVLSQVDTVEEDGFLTMEEILGLRLNADLVTLSACKTGLGEQVKGEGIVGLSRAFMYAGTKSVLVSLWSVSSNSTEALMKAFYTYTKQGKSKSEALRLAKRDIRKGTFELSIGRGLEVTERKIKVSGSHPFFWAPFVLIGEWK